MDIRKKPYEISLWDEQLVWHRRKLAMVELTAETYKRGVYYVQTDALGTAIYDLSYDDYTSGETYYQLASLEEADAIIESENSNEISISLGTHPNWYDESGNPLPQVIASFYKETRLCTIGSNTMDSLARCVNPKLVSKVNGENTLTFTMYYQYIDTETGEKIDNPFIPYMVNERKVKLQLDGEWYDLVIKQIQENSETKAFTYTCKDQSVNELSKTGFDLVLDSELENNMGTIEQLAETILEGSDWKLAASDKLKQFVEEPLYEIVLGENISAKEMETEVEIAIPKGKKIYGFYSHVNDKISDFQFLYEENENFAVDDDLVIDKVEHPNYIINNTIFSDDKPQFASSCVLTTKYRGMRLVRQIQIKYDSTIDKFVQVFKKDDEIYYGFQQTDYVTPTTVSNYVVNPSAFTSTTGWYAEKNEDGARPSLDLVTNPPLTSETVEKKFTTYLKFSNNGAKLMNSSINGFKSTLKGFVKGQTEFVLRIKYKEVSEQAENYATTAPSAKICRYDINDQDHYELLETLFEFKSFKNANDYVYMKATCKISVSETALKSWENRYGLFFEFTEKDEEGNLKNIYIEEVQLFPYIEVDGSLCVPGAEGLFIESKTTWKYYLPNKDYTSIKDVVYVDESETKLEDYIEQYNDGADAFTKVTSITAKESNRFNLLQDLNEKFECWARFKIEHNEDGSIKLGKDMGKLTGDEAYRQQKFVSFHEYTGERNFAGFRYGVNSKSIQRTIDSNAIVSKMIVKNNANEFAPNGFCSVARASENPIKENFLLSFDHYIRHDLLDLDVVTNDLYLDSNGYIGYYKKLKEMNQGREEKIEKQSRLLTDMSKYESTYQTYKLSYDAAVEERLVIEEDMRRLVIANDTDTFEDVLAKGASEGWKDQDKFISYQAKWARCKNVEDQHQPLYIEAQQKFEGAKAEYDSITAELEDLANKKRALNLQFYKKYSRFIQEGSWIKEDYVDDNLYYLGAVSTLHTSAQPKVTYTINVLELSQLPEYEGYKFNLGDRTYIEDIEFFGWSLRDMTTPYREEIVISEISQELDSPEKNVIKVQNYKNQFEDLFQRITAQTQQAEYHSGEYQRAANVVETDGTISQATLENSFANNSFILQNARDQSVVIDENGITTTSLSNPSEVVRIVAGGIMMSTDGGQSWKTGLTGYGLNSSYLTAGQINADEIYIMNGKQPAFRWDENGLSAYSHNVDEEGNRTGYNTNKYVRFDQFGIYGVIGDEDNFKPQNTKDVHSIAQFALTWDGFSLKNEDGSVRISSGNDIQVLSKDENNNQLERVKIGRLGKNGENWVYGIRISNGSGEPVMETDDSGELWLRKELKVSTIGGNTVRIGQINSGEDRSIVFDANNKFTVYEDGEVKAENIKAFGGNIGPMLVDEKGLSLTNSNFIIYQEAAGTKTPTFKAENGNITLTGEVHATSGSFEGTIKANAGSIGGLSLESGILKSGGGENPNLEINTNTGKITANEIELGTSASIINYIQLGNAYIQNPTNPNTNNTTRRPFITAGENEELKIFDNGVANFGAITIDGPNSEIYGANFSITPDYANFSNINCSGVIETVVFKKNSIQAAGGTMVFRPSYKIKNIDGSIIMLEEDFIGEGQTAIWLVENNNSSYKEVRVEKIAEEPNKLRALSDINGAYNLLIDIGPVENSENTTTIDSFIMGINAGNSSIGANEEILPRGLTVKGKQSTPSLFLGDLSTPQIKAAIGYGTSGYGLYCDNVYLRGSLVTNSTTGKTAGINTTSGVTGNENVGDNSPIIFWAGANGITEDAIRNALFQVTENGAVRAMQAIFSDSVFAGGEIKSSSIRAAKIYGDGPEGQPALSIYDTTQGITFYDENEIETFSIGSNSFVKDSTPFIDIGEKDAQFFGYFKGSLSTDNGKIFEEDNLIISYNEEPKITIDSDISEIYGNIKFINTIANAKSIEYRQVNGGYDLYIA